MVSHTGRGAVIDINAGIQGFESNHFGFTGHHLRVHCAASRAVDCVQIHGMSEGTIHFIAHGDFNGVTNTSADERTRHRAVESEIGISGAIGQLAFYFLANQLHLHQLGSAGANRAGEIARILDDRCTGSGSRRFTHLQCTHHACGAMAGDIAVILKGSFLISGEGDHTFFVKLSHRTS